MKTCENMLVQQKPNINAINFDSIDMSLIAVMQQKIISNESFGVIGNSRNFRVTVVLYGDSYQERVH